MTVRALFYADAYAFAFFWSTRLPGSARAWQAYYIKIMYIPGSVYNSEEIKENTYTSNSPRFFFTFSCHTPVHQNF